MATGLRPTCPVCAGSRRCVSAACWVCRFCGDYTAYSVYYCCNKCAIACDICDHCGNPFQIRRSYFAGVLRDFDDAAKRHIVVKYFDTDDPLPSPGGFPKLMGDFIEEYQSFGLPTPAEIEEMDKQRARDARATLIKLLNWEIAKYGPHPGKPAVVDDTNLDQFIGHDEYGQKSKI